MLSVLRLTFTDGDYARARRKYRPVRIRILFVAESPPSSGGYFYFSKTVGKDHLFRETMKALGFWPLSQPMGHGIDKRPLLEKFCSSGFFLIDTCGLPVDKLPTKTRVKKIGEGALRIASRVRHLNPGSIVVIKKTVFHPVRDSLVQAGLGNKVLNKKPLPFP
ncbi:MAG TPA: hypothetical protein VE955_00995, partial [Candidatus Dormibacteraeota bacterium]|nr:hypothetical protein [Candidatus Dormibacteraeota bacterium]